MLVMLCRLGVMKVRQKGSPEAYHLQVKAGRYVSEPLTTVIVSGAASFHLGEMYE